METMTIKDAARVIKRSEQTIVGWEREGLITIGRDDRGWRMFTQDNIEQLEAIKKRKREALATKSS